MNNAVLRASGPEFDVDAFLARFPALQRAAHPWRRGVPGRDGSANDTSGFNLGVADAETFRGALDRARAFLADHAEALAALRPAGASGLLDVGVVGSPQGLVRNLRLTREDLAWLAQSGLEFEITAYPPDVEDAVDALLGH